MTLETKIENALAEREKTVSWLTEAIVEETYQIVQKLTNENKPWPSCLKRFFSEIKKGKNGFAFIGLALECLQQIAPENSLDLIVTIEAVKMFSNLEKTNQNYLARMSMYVLLSNSLKEAFQEKAWFNHLELN